ncbi:RelA/SpoT domain-containing protein [Nocardioides nematodiphilus]|uniref:RelA/SpoT domain-containing protein n=1 Tax=Nocardioides nematodiphilus TaxID=2849669 RepID=UPI001CD982D7|nr:RelA/SpoT domain-containing protein [Nocardioides nematodiphilus]MCA1982972.1 RelA/SpoT domain-containing protein [Nocardioides nematodiphilus]
MSDSRNLDPAATYKAAKPFLDAALEHYQGTVATLLKGQVPEHYVIGRVKTARSLIRKLRERPNEPRTWDSITDKVGVRVICTSRMDCDAATQLISDGPWTVLKTERKTGKHDKLFYPGIHVEIQSGNAVDHAGSRITCEVQIRTRAQDAWAVASHKLTYKGAVVPPKRMRRLVDRLTVFVEVFDDEIHRLFKKRGKLPMYVEAVALEKLEETYERLSGEPAEGAKDLSIVAILMAAYDDSEKLAVTDLVDQYCGSTAGIAEVIQAHSYNAEGYRDQADWLFTQPEVLLVLERARAKPYLLLNAVANTDLEDVVRATAISAGTPLPAE